MSLLKAIKAQLGLSNTPANNFTLTAEADNGTLKLARGNAGATTQDLITVSANGNVQLTKTTDQSMVRLNTLNGFGSTNTRIARFTNIVTNQGADVTYADSATLGGSFTVNTNGVYAISFSGGATTGGTIIGASLNTSSPITSIQSLPIGEILSCSYAPVGGVATSAWTGFLTAGAVVRAHTDGGAINTAVTFTITRVA